MTNADGLYLEEGTTNLEANPSFETGTSPWNATNTTVSQSSAQAWSGTYACQCTATADGNEGSTQVGLNHGGVSLAVAPHVISYYVYHELGTSRSCGVRYNGVTYAGQAVPSGVWTRITQSVTGSGASAFLVLMMRDAQIADVFYIDGIQIEQSSYATSYCDGSLGSGYSWSGTAHASSSTRAAASVSVDEADHIDPDAGEVAFRFVRNYDTGAAEPILDVGDGGAGYDRMQLRINASDKLEMGWTSDGASETTTASTESITAGTEYFVRCYWDGTSTGISIDNAAASTGTRDAPQGSWGTTSLVLEAS